MAAHVSSPQCCDLSGAVGSGHYRRRAYRPGGMDDSRWLVSQQGTGPITWERWIVLDPPSNCHSCPASIIGMETKNQKNRTWEVGHRLPGDTARAVASHQTGVSQPCRGDLCSLPLQPMVRANGCPHAAAAKEWRGQTRPGLPWPTGQAFLQGLARAWSNSSCPTL